MIVKSFLHGGTLDVANQIKSPPVNFDPTVCVDSLAALALLLMQCQGLILI